MNRAKWLWVVPLLGMAQAVHSAPQVLAPGTVLPSYQVPRHAVPFASESVRDMARQPAFGTRDFTTRVVPRPGTPGSPQYTGASGYTTRSLVPPGTSSGSPHAPAASISGGFVGLSNKDFVSATGGDVIPPDTMGAVGPSHIAEFTNGMVGFFSKKGNKISQVPIDNFFNFSGAPAFGNFDPHVVYDPNSGRFIAVCSNGSAAPNSALMIAVSATSDPTGVWNKWSIDADVNNGPGGATQTDNWFDYPSLGMDSSAIYVTGNLFPTTGTGKFFQKLWIIPKAQLLSGSATLTWTENTNISGFTFQPCVTFDAGATEYMVDTAGLDGLNVYTVTNPTNNPTVTFAGKVAVPGFAVPVGVPQSGGANLLDGGDQRLLNAVYRNGSIWCAHNISLNGVDAARWYQINTKGSVNLAQAGNVSDPNRYYFYPTIAVNSHNDVALGFSGSNSSQFASTYLTVHHAADLPGQTDTPVLTQPGAGFYFKDFGSGENRWGDYSATCVDPTDDSTFWTVQEFADSASNTWGTWWASTSVVVDTIPPVVTITSPLNNSSINSFASVTGTAVDKTSAGTPGVVTQLNVYIQRNSDGQFWSGTTWTPTRTPLPTVLNADGTWSISPSAPLPSGSNLVDGTYTVTAIAIDQSANQSSAVVIVNVDATAPIITITTPANNSVAQSITSITGTARDNTGGSGLKTVAAFIQRQGDGKFWNGSDWSVSGTPLPVILNSDGTWATSSALPLPGNVLLDGNYTIYGQAVDIAGNTATTTATITITSGLRISLNAPTNNGAIHDFAVTAGTASENPQSSGVISVTVKIQRQGDGAYWNGSGWSSTPVALPTILNSDGTWSLNGAGLLPTGVNLLDGPYILTAIATDRAGNMATISIALTVDSTPPTVSIRSPLNNANIRKFPVIVGKADDNPGGSGIDHVDLMIKRYDGVYWNGTLWTEAPSVLETLRSNDDWSFTTEASPIAGLSDGQYTLTAIAYDRAGGSSSASRTITLDSTAPQAPIITTPTNNTFVKRFGAIQGLASDNVSGNGVTRAAGANGSGVSHVDLNIQRRSDGKWWSGGSWSDTPIGIPTSFANGKWTRNSGFPAGSYLTDGQYTITAITYDKAGNRTVGSSTTLTVDVTAPNLAFVSPALNSGAQRVPVVRGTVDDGTGSGVKSVTLTIQRRTDGKYWSGSTWAIKQTQLATALSGGNWSLRNGLPTGANLPAGNYYFIAQATDKIGNVRRLVSAVSVDTTAPSTVTFTTPRADATIGSLATVQGNVVDNSGGSGIDHVELTIQRQKDGLFWSGVRWSAVRTALTTKLTGRVWKSNTNLLAANIGSGTYTLTATAFDKAGNSSRSSIKVSGGPVAGLSADTSNSVPSSVKLSQTAARVAAGSLQLRFTGALDADTAADASHYSVTVNGQAVEVESAGYDAATHSVLLALPEGSLRVGDVVTVGYKSLLDLKGATVNGQSALVTVR